MPAKYSLHIGLNSVDRNNYSGSYRSLLNAENDAKYYHRIAVAAGFDAILLVGPQATANSLIMQLKSIGRKIKPGDIFFLSYAGHGTFVKDLNSEPGEEGFDEAFILYDRIFIDDEFDNYWRIFPKGANIFFVTDSCYNASVSRIFEKDKLLIAWNRPNEIFRYIPSEISNVDFNRNLGFYASIQKDRLPRKPGCNIIHIAACQDNQTANDGTAVTMNGVFTWRFKNLYNEGQFTGTYRQFFDDLHAQMTSGQTPNWDTATGSDTSEFETMPMLK